jgi:hypothetical protein
VERATRADLWAPGEEVLLTWSPDHSFVVAVPNAPTDAVPDMDTETPKEETTV